MLQFILLSVTLTLCTQMDTQKDHLINNIMGNRWNIYYNDYEGGADAISRLNNIKKDYFSHHSHRI